MSLVVKNLTRTFGQIRAVDDLSFVVEKGTVFGLLGRNGAGKSTAIKQILGLIEPTSGSMEWEGKTLEPNQLSIGYLPEERGLFVKKSVYKQLRYFGLLEGMSKENIESAMDILRKLADMGVVPKEFNVAPPTMQEIFVKEIG